MYSERVDFSITLALLADLHIGDGNAAKLSSLRQSVPARGDPDKEDSDPLVATICRDNKCRPWIPPTSLKGALRSLDVTPSPEAVFGEVAVGKSPSEKGQGGCLILWGGSLVDESKQQDLLLPLWEGDVTQSFIKAHVTIDRTTGAAMRARLFFREYVPKDVQFKVDGCWLGNLAEFERFVLPLFDRAARADGFPLGASTRAGNGRVRLVETQIVTTRRRLAVDAGKPTIETDENIFTVRPHPVPPTIELELHCPGPFLIVDPRRSGSANDDIDMRAYQRNAAIAELLGESLLGAVRSRASWLQQTRMGFGPDNREAIPGSDLSPCQGLFGISGHAGKLGVVSIEHLEEPADQRVYPGVALNDLTQGVVAGAVFAQQAPANVRFSLRLELTRKRQLSGDEHILFGHILKDAEQMGWKIGHSSGVGFGWFQVTQTSLENAETNAYKALEPAEEETHA
jgi:CRISPR/Cas system CSM-associated protein Csm3 (group 7 of RAMP superfamily)